MADINLWTNQETCPASYTTGGFNVVTTLSTIANADIQVKTPGANLPSAHFEWTASGATLTIKVIQHSHDKLTDVGNMNGLPSGVTAATTSGQTYDADAAHVHSIAHTHATFNTATETASGGGVILDAVGSKDILNHLHSVVFPAFSGNSAAGTSHDHTWDNIYQHQHALTNTSTNATQAELANGTNLSGTTLIVHAVDA